MDLQSQVGRKDGVDVENKGLEEEKMVERVLFINLQK